MINILVKEELTVSISKGFEVVSNFQNYHTWWKIPVKTEEYSLDYFEFSPLPLTKIGIKVTVLKTDLTVRFDYVKGPFRGYGLWKFEKLANETNQLSYEIFLDPINAFYKYASNSALFSERHQNDIREIIEQINTH